MSLQVRLVLIGLAVAALAAMFWPKSEKAATGGFLLDAGGRPAPLATHMAPVTLVHFWATWCPPCMEEVPALRRLIRDYSDRDDFSVLMVAVNDSSDRVKSFLGSGADMVLFDPSWEVAHRYGTRQVPETYLVVRGKVVEKFVGQTNWDDPAVRGKLTAHLGA